MSCELSNPLFEVRRVKRRWCDEWCKRCGGGGDCGREIGFGAACVLGALDLVICMASAAEMVASSEMACV